MNKKFIFYTTLLLVFFLVFQPVISFMGVTFYESPSVSAIGEDEVYKGLGIAVVLYIISKVATGREVEVEDPVVDLTKEERDLFVRLISAEAKGESFSGQVAVGAVVLNRIASDKFPDSIEGVIRQNGQFTPVRNGSIELKPSESAYKAAEEALAGNDPTEGAVYFYNPDKADNMDWFEKNVVKTDKIGSHVFGR
ncbi:MAG: cell wall hydrolase [Bacillota bacterium]